MNIKNKLVSLSLVTILSIGGTGLISYADSQDLKSTSVATYEEPIKEKKFKKAIILTEEQKSLLEKGYNELDQDEKEVLGKYYTIGMMNLTDEELKEMYKIQDKVYKYMDEEYKAMIQEKRAKKEMHRQKIEKKKLEKQNTTKDNE